MSWDEPATLTLNGNTVTMGRSDLYVEMYRVEDDNQPGETNYACIPHLKQWPGVKLQGAAPALNDYTKLIQNWSKNDYGGVEITDWGPTKERKGSLNWSLSLQAGADGPSGGITASYSTPYIKRMVTSDYNETVAHEYGYPNNVIDPWNAEARKQIVGIENAGEAWLADSDSYLVDLLTVRANSKFAGMGFERWVGVEMEIDKLGLYL